jgi:large subunit ribosomal protein L24
MRIKKNDNVKVLSGKDRGKTGKVIQVFPKLGKVVVEGVNLAKKHVRSRRQGDAGQRLEYASPMNAASVMLICPKCDKPTRIGMQSHTGTDGKTKKVRACKKCGEALE